MQSQHCQYLAPTGSHSRMLSGDIRHHVSVLRDTQVGEEAGADGIDDPWPKPGRHAQAQELPEALSTSLLDETLPLTPRELWRLVMADAGFFRGFSSVKTVAELRLGRWQLSGSAQPHLAASCILLFCAPDHAQAVVPCGCMHMLMGRLMILEDHAMR